MAVAMAAVGVGDRETGMVSVIMPFLDPPEPFFRDAVASIEAQTYKNWELVLVDDGSSGPVSRVGTEFAERRAGQIRYIDHDGHRNLGISASRNAGIAIARGEYIAFLDADDLWDPAQLSDQVALLEQNPAAALLYGNTLYWHSWEGSSENAAQDVTYELGVSANRLIDPPGFLRRILARTALPPCMTAIIVRRQVFDSGIDFEASFPRHYEDQVFVAKVASQLPIYAASTTWGKYRQHKASVTGGIDDTEEALVWRQKYLKWMSAYLEEQNINDRKLNLLIRLESGALESRSIATAARVYRLWRGRFRRLFARFSRR